MFKKLTDNIYKLDIPFDNITTSSFLLTHSEGNILVDCGTYKSDVTDYILPALKKLNVTPNYLFLTHFHSDHSGGAEALFAEFKNLKLICFQGEICKKFGGILLLNNQEVIKDIYF